MAFGYVGGHGAENKKRLELKGKPNYFDKSLLGKKLKKSKTKTFVAKASPEKMAALKKRLKTEKRQQQIVLIASILLTLAIAYIVYLWLF